MRGLVALVLLSAPVVAGLALVAEVVDDDAVVAIEAEHVDVEVPVIVDVGDLATSGRPFPNAFTVGSGAVTTIQLSSTAVTKSMRCLVTTSGTPLYLVDPTAADTSTGEGPYCVDCSGGPIVPIPAAKAYARTSSGSANVRCSFYDGDLIATAGSGPSAGGTIAAGTTPQVAYYTGANAIGSNAALQFPAGAVVVNEAGADVDTRVESDTVPAALFVDGATGQVGIGTSSVISATQAQVDWSSTTSSLALYGQNNNSAGIAGVQVANVGAGVIGNSFRVYGSTSAETFLGTTAAGNAGLIAYGAALTAVKFGTDEVDIPFIFGQRIGAELTGIERFRLDADGEVVVNEQGLSYVDLRAESDNNANMLVVDASADCVSIGDAACSTPLDVNGTTTSTTFRGADGSSAAPTYSFANEVGLGMYLDDASQTLIVDGQVSAGVGNFSVVAGNVAAVSVGANGSWGMTDADSGAEISGDGATGEVVVNADVSATITAGSSSWVFDDGGIVAPHRTTTTPATLEFPSAIATVPGTPPACSAATPAAAVYVDDTDDALPAFLCVCAANAAGTYAYRPIGDFTTTCP